MKMKIFVIVAMVCLFAGSSFAAIFSIDGHVDDKTWDGNGGSTWVGQPTGGVGYNSSLVWTAHILVFELPDLGGEAIATANLLMHGSDSSWGEGLNIDLYGLRTSAASATSASDHYAGQLDVANTLIMQDFAVKPKGNPAPANARDMETDVAGDAALAAFLTSVYAGGAVAGEYVFLRVNPDTEFQNSSNSYITFDTANSSTGQVPVLTIETVPEPASLGLIVMGGLMMMRRR